MPIEFPFLRVQSWKSWLHIHSFGSQLIWFQKVLSHLLYLTHIHSLAALKAICKMEEYINTRKHCYDLTA